MDGTGDHRVNKPGTGRRALRELTHIWNLKKLISWKWRVEWLLLEAGRDGGRGVGRG